MGSFRFPPVLISVITLYVDLLEGLGACLVLQLVHLSAPPALLDACVRGELLTAHSLDFDDVDPADHSLDLLVDRDKVKHLVVGDQVHEFRTYLGLDDRNP